MDFPFSFSLENPKFNFFSQKNLNAFQTLHENTNYYVIPNDIVALLTIKD